MFTIKDYIVAESLDQAAELLGNNPNNFILGGLLWLKMGRHAINHAIDISHLGLNTIIDGPDTLTIGAMVSLRDLETHMSTNKYFGGIIADSVRQIVGVSFRNSATIGGSIYSRFGFSDPLTALLALDTTVHLYHGGALPLVDFLDMPYQKDILTHLTIKKDQRQGIYLSQRNSATDFPLITVAASQSKSGYTLSIGARPNKARLAIQAGEALGLCPDQKQIDQALALIGTELSFGDNMRGSAAYRHHLAQVLSKRAITALTQLEDQSC